MDESTKPPKAKPAKFPKTKVINPKRAANGRIIPDVMAPVLLQTKTTEKSMVKFIKAMCVAYCPSLLNATFESLLEKCVNGDEKAMQRVLEIYNLLGKSTSGTLVQVIQQVNAGSSPPDRQESGYRRSLEYAIREQEKRKQIESGQQIIDVTAEPVQS